MSKRPQNPRLPVPMHRRPETAEPEPQARERGIDLAGPDWKEKLEAKLALLPKQPGVYVMRDKRGRVLYVGKAKSLRSRVRSYFRGPEPSDFRLVTLRRRIRILDYIAVSSEVEALILEAHLIKQHTPRFNVQLKDDKRYPYIKVTVGSPFPGMFLTRHVVPDGSRYFGPFIRVKDLRQTLKVLRSVFQLRNCTDQRLARNERECLQFFIGRCTAPCTHRVTQEEYALQVGPLIDFLSGRGDEVLAKLEERMRAAAAAYRYEEAARLRDGIATLEELMKEQRMTPPQASEADVIGLSCRADLACAVFLHVHEGKVVGKSHRILTGVQGAPEEETLRALLLALFLDAPSVPGTLVMRVEPADRQGIAQVLTERSGHKVTLQSRPRGHLRRLVEVAEENAHLLLEEEQLAIAAKRGRVDRSVYALQEALDLPHPPYRIEGYDISNFQGSHPVASVVTFQDGTPLKSAYRHIRMDAIPGPDDFAMIGETLRRRLLRITTRGETPPDLILIDGGRGQVGRARLVLEEMGFAHLPLVGLAKREEEIILPHGGPSIVLPRSSPALQLLQQVRDEAHRFAIAYHRLRRRRAQSRSQLDSIPGIGPNRRRLLLRKFGSVAGIQRAPESEIAAVKGIGPKLARILKEALDGTKAEPIGPPAESS